MADEPVLLALEDTLATLTINRPATLNSLDETVLDALLAALDALATTQVRCAIVTGAGGRAFVAGADIAAMSVMSPEQALQFARKGQAVFARIESLPMPVIAAVDGFALGGGCELALACDFIYGSDKAKLGQPEVKLGILPGFGGTQRLARRVGLGLARELVYSGRIVGAEEALRMGLLNAVVPRAELLTRVREVANEIAGMSPAGVMHAKRVMNEGEGLSLDRAIELEALAFARCFEHPDQREGMTAFLQKRSPAFATRPR